MKPEAPAAETANQRVGPLTSIRVLEIGSLGPGPFCAMMLADLGADVLRLDRITKDALENESEHRQEMYHRGRCSVAVDLKHPESAALVLDLVETADALIEGFRPGVVERLGIGPEPCLARNPRLIYGRVTGYGQDGPRANDVGHDLNYVAASGVLNMIGRKDAAPTPPLNLVGDAGGGGLILAFGILAAIVNCRQTGQGQVVDAAMIEGSATLAAPLFAWKDSGKWSQKRGTNLFDSGSPFYDSYETADGRWLSVAAVEPRFYQALLDLLGLDPGGLPDQNDQSSWPEMKRKFAGIIRMRTRDDWCTRAEGLEACVAPVLELDELESNPHLRHRGTFVRKDGVLQPAPSPRFSATPARLSLRPSLPGEHTAQGLAGWGIDAARIESLKRSGAIHEEPSNKGKALP